MTGGARNIHYFLLLFLAFSIGACGLARSAALAPEAAAGVIDLSGCDFAGDISFPLIGEWLFYWNSLKTPEDFKNTAAMFPQTFAWGPQGWSQTHLRLGIPGNSPYFGCATYRLKVLLPEGLTQVGVALPQQHSAYRVYLNGVLAYTNGMVDPDPVAYRAEWKPGVVSVPVPDGELEIILQIANFTMKSGGYFYAIRIGGERTILSAQRFWFVYESFIFGALIILAVYYVFFSYFQGWDPPSLLFSVSSLLYALRVVTHGEILLSQFFTLDLEFINRIRYLSLFILPVTIFAFVRRILSFSARKYILLERSCFFLCGWFCLIVVTTPVAVYVTTLDYFFIVLLFAAIPTMMMAAGAVRRGNRIAWFLLIGFVIIVTTAGMDLYASSHRFGGYAYWSPLGFFLFSLFYALVLGKKFAAALQFEKKQAIEHGRTAEILDVQVHERTLELSAANQALEAAAQEANKASKAKTEFLAMMSHEIRTPMNAVVGITEILGRTPLNELQRDYIMTLRSATNNLLFILDDILDFSRLESGRVQIDMAATNLRNIIGEAAAVYLPGAQKKGLYLKVEIEETCPLYVLTDAHRLKQILTNLIGNALKFTSVGGIILRMQTVGSASGSGMVTCEFQIEDTGIGIAQDKITKIFESFEQADNSTTRKFGGTGLGLAISKRLVELLGGTITVSSREGRGSTFHVILSFETSEPAVSGIVVSGDGRTDFDPGSCRLLMVEDNATNILVTKAIISTIGWSCRIAETGKEAIEILSQEDFDVVLMDLEIPVLDGIETTRLIRGGKAGLTAKTVPILAMTAHALPAYRDEAMKAGMNGYLTKPVTRSALISAVIGVHPENQQGRTSCLNVEAALKNFDGNLPFLLNLYQAFAEDITLSLSSIQDALESRDFGAVMKLSRTIESSALLIEQKRTECLAGELSYAAAEKNLSLCIESFRVLEPDLLDLREKIHLILADQIAQDKKKAVVAENDGS